MEDTFGGNTSHPTLGVDFSTGLRHLNLVACNEGARMQIPIIDMKPGDLRLGLAV